MRFRPLGHTGLRVSVVGFGGIPIQRISRAEAVAVVRLSLERGINFFDTAIGYTDSEEKLGAALAGGLRNRAILATKTPKASMAEAAEQLDTSLRRLQTDHVELYQLHNVGSLEDLERRTGPGGAYEAALAAKNAGKVLHIGVTTHKIPVGLAALKSGLFESIMIPFSILENEPAAELMPLAKRLGVGFIAMKPIGGGVITHAALSLRYVLSQGADIVIPGMQSAAEVEENAAVGDAHWALNPEEMAALQAEADALGRSFCRRCDYCQPCAQGIRISTLLHAPSVFLRSGWARLATDKWADLVATAATCTECGECMARCPYGLRIPELLKENVTLIRRKADELGISLVPPSATVNSESAGARPAPT
jgi:hypothetical protein